MLKSQSKIFGFLLLVSARAAIVPPPWANPSSNPCAAQPRGWQLLFWPDDKKCYKIFQIGAPCPETMELGPSAEGGGTIAECRCPPGTVQSARDALCHPIFTRASCPRGQFFAPVPETESSRKRWGVCRDPEPCSEKGDIYWPKDGTCYPKLTKGPCSKGELLVAGEDGLATCSCSEKGVLRGYYSSGEGGGCYEHYTRGPCAEDGELFLPGGNCGCHSDLPHYYVSNKKCYQLGGIGPCLPGQHFVITHEAENLDDQNPLQATCQCKPGHVPYKNGLCYRVYTRGPCENGEMLVNSTSCLPVPCRRGRLFFPLEETCYKTGSRGPCPSGQIVIYDYSTRPSIDGISYRGVCGCTYTLKDSGKCFEDEARNCEDVPGTAFLKKTCYKLYTQGPCTEGEWLVAQRIPKGAPWQEGKFPKARCECRPGYTRISVNETSNIDNNNLISPGGCQPPAVSLARFLNARVRSIGF